MRFLVTQNDSELRYERAVLAGGRTSEVDAGRPRPSRPPRGELPVPAAGTLVPDVRTARGRLRDLARTGFPLITDRDDLTVDGRFSTPVRVLATNFSGGAGWNRRQPRTAPCPRSLPAAHDRRLEVVVVQLRLDVETLWLVLSGQPPFDGGHDPLLSRPTLTQFMEAKK
jgi:hypothetical protein